jgi:hypothetical protein
MLWKTFGGEKRAHSRQLTVEKKEFYTEVAEGTEFTEKRRKTKRRDTEYAEKKKQIPRFARNDNSIESRRAKKSTAGS